MPQSLALKNNLDDALKEVRIVDFSGGLNSEADPQDLDVNTSPDCLNVKLTKPGRVIGRDGFVARVTGLPADPDGIAYFNDSNGARRLAIWAGGNLYECTSYVAVAVSTGIYTAGNRITCAHLNSILYYSDGYTITGSGATAYGIRKWDPAAGTDGGLISSGSAGTIPTPACKAMTVYAGQLVVTNLKYTDGTTAKDTIIPSNVNDPTTIVGTNAIRVGQGQGGEINVVMPFGVSSVGVTPYRALFVGKSEFGVFLLKGSLSSAEEVLINCPTGVLDGATAKFVPIAGVGGAIVFLGKDGKVYQTTGVTSEELSGPIRSELAQYVADQISASATSIFTAVMNYQDFQYVLDLGGGRQYCFDYDRKCWTKYDGWPSGYWVDARDGNGQQTIYCADIENAQMCQVNIGLDDGGTTINHYWKTPFMSAGDSNVLKIWKFIYAAFMTDTGGLSVTATVNLGRGSAATVTLTPSSYAEGSSSRWDIAQWDSGQWVASSSMSYTPYKAKGRLMISTSGLDGSYESLRGYDVQVKIAGSNSHARFELLGFSLFYLPRGRKRVA